MGGKENKGGRWNSRERGGGAPIESNTSAKQTGVKTLTFQVSLGFLENSQNNKEKEEKQARRRENERASVYHRSYKE